MMDEELIAFFREQGVEVDDEGYPKGMSLLGPPQKCDLCGTLAESPIPALVVERQTGTLRQILICADCYRTSMSDPDTFWRKMDAAMTKDS